MKNALTGFFFHLKEGIQWQMPFLTNLLDGLLQILWDEFESGFGPFSNAVSGSGPPSVGKSVFGPTTSMCFRSGSGSREAKMTHKKIDKN